MSNQIVTPEIIANISKFGTYYNPASNHYGKEVNVICDKCKKNGLNVCIGWQTFDLCLKCAEEVSRPIIKPNPQIYTLMMQSQFREPQVVSMMLQSQFRDNDNLTFMMQNQFRDHDDEPPMYSKMMQSQFSKPKQRSNKKNSDDQ